MTHESVRYIIVPSNLCNQRFSRMTTLFTLRQVSGGFLRSGQVLQRASASNNVQLCAKVRLYSVFHDVFTLTVYWHLLLCFAKLWCLHSKTLSLGTHVACDYMGPVGLLLYVIFFNITGPRENSGWGAAFSWHGKKPKTSQSKKKK